jgi:chemotaxis protein MotB
MRTRRRLLSDSEGVSEVWPAFTDVMSTLALILFVLVLLSYVRSLVSTKQLEAFRRQIIASQAKLEVLHGQLQAGKASLDASRIQLSDQQWVIAETSRQLDTVRSQLQSIAVLRVDVLHKLEQAIEAQLGRSVDGGAALVTIGDNGNLLVNESLVFEFNSYAIKKEAKPVLDTLAKALGNVLADAAVRANIDTIVIQGHTDERGSPSFNWELSARRATAVLDYLFDANTTLADSYGRYFAASAYSKYRPIDPDKTEPAYQQNRRIEISIVPKDDNVRAVIEEYMKNTAPSSPAQPPP